MKTKILAAMLAVLAVTTLSLDAAAHEGGEPEIATIEETVIQGPSASGSVVLTGSVRELKRALFDLECWPEVFSDARSLKRQRDGSWSVDFKLFQHAHPFRAKRSGNSVVFELAAQNHGAARMEYVLRPIDRTHSTLTVRLAMATPPQFTEAQANALLRSKEETDLSDFRRYAEQRAIAEASK